MKENGTIKEFRSMTRFALDQPLRWIIQHHLNSLRIYSFIRRLRFSRKSALKLAAVYERLIHPLLYDRRIVSEALDPVLVSVRENTGIHDVFLKK